MPALRAGGTASVSEFPADWVLYTMSVWFARAAALLFVVAGSLHFIKTALYLRIMPPYIPWHVAMVRVSGFFEILGGLGLLSSRTRGIAAWALIALLIAVFPANLYMATNPADTGASSIPAVLRWARLPLQGLLILWLVWCRKAR
jgi:uncharacterized membrane protein